MTQSILHHVHDVLLKTGVQSTDTLIVAISGGVDSMVLLEHCRLLGFHCIAAHVNYGLRGSDSEADEKLVTDYCGLYSIPCETLRVQNTHWQLHKGSTQEAARSIRYDWFEQLRKKHAVRYTLTAHHANDQTETMLMQFIRGGGGKSVYGMAVVQDGVLRPMLSITRDAIRRYASEYAIPWRDDQSNDTDAYTRNFIRLHILPLVEQLNPEIHETIQQRSVWMHEEQRLTDIAAQNYLALQLQIENNSQSLSIRSLKESGNMHVLLWKWLVDYGFTSGQVVRIAQAAGEAIRSEAAQYSSATHDVWIQQDRIACVRRELMQEVIIEKLPCEYLGMRFDNCAADEVVFGPDSERQYIDTSNTQAPLLLRPWKAGDRFFPLGAPGEQKVSDFLTHAKVPAWKKPSIMVLEADNLIVAVVGHRISEKFKVTTKTGSCLRIHISGS